MTEREKYIKHLVLNVIPTVFTILAMFFLGVNFLAFIFPALFGYERFISVQLFTLFNYYAMCSTLIILVCRLLYSKKRA